MKNPIFNVRKMMYLFEHKEFDVASKIKLGMIS